MEDKNSKKELTVKKVPLAEFIELLSDIFANGADFIDLHGVHYSDPDVEDQVTVSVIVDYISQEDKLLAPPLVEDIIIEDFTILTEEIIKDLLKNG
jgi:hypothetical protein